MPMVDAALKTGGIRPADLDLFAVTAGPRQLYRTAHRAGRSEGYGPAGKHPLRRRIDTGGASLVPYRQRYRDRRDGCTPGTGILGRL